jgi:sugar phosphate permease
MIMARQWVVFVLASANFFLSQFYRTTNAVISPQLLQDLRLDTEGLGFLSAVFFYAFALAQIPISVTIDRIGPKLMMSGLSVVGICGALLFSWADSLVTGAAGRLLLGIGMACNLMGTLKLLTIWFPPHRFGSLSGIVFSLGFAGNVASTTPFVLMVNLVGWRTAFQIISGINFLLVVVFYLVVREESPWRSSPSDKPLAPSFNESFNHLSSLLKKKDFWIIGYGSFCSYGIFAAFQALWAGPYLMEVMGLSAEAAGNVILLCNFAVIFGTPLWGAVSDRLLKTRKWIVVGGHICLIPITAAMAMFSPGTSLTALIILFSSFGFFRATQLLMFAQVKDLVPLSVAGMAMTGINFFSMMGSAAFLQGLGHLMQALYPQASRGPDAFRAALLLCSAILLSVCILYALTREKEARELSELSQENIGS